LYAYLGEHPDVLRARKKEISFFSYGYLHGWAWYLAYFRRKPGGQAVITGEASPNYMLHPLAAERARHDIPDVRLIAILRNPVDRAYSQFQQTRNLGREPLETFEDALEREPERVYPELKRLKHEPGLYSFNVEQFSYLTRGMYYDQLKVWNELFPREQLLILCAEEFFANTGAVMHQVQDFLGIPHFDLPTYQPQDLKSRGRNYDPMKGETRRRLVEYFRPHNHKLYELARRSFPWDK
jgi:Sulfotransferase domain